MAAACPVSRTNGARLAAVAGAMTSAVAVSLRAWGIAMTTISRSLAESAIARHVVAQIRAGWPGWRIFLTDTGRWQATTLRRPAVIPADHWQPRHTVMCPDAVDADEYDQLAVKLRERCSKWQ